MIFINYLYINTGVLRTVMWLTLAVCLMMPGHSTALTYNGTVSASWGVEGYEFLYYGSNTADELTFSGSYQPRSGQGLVGVSATVDVLGRGGAQSVTSAALYGTDSTRSNVGSLDPALIASGIGVEPMVDIQASATGGEFGDGINRVSYGSTGAYLHISVLHRVILNPEITIPQAILGNVLNQLNSVPLQVLWAYSVTGSGGGGRAEFRLSVDSSTGDCATGVAGLCGNVRFFDLQPGAANSGSVPFTAVATTTGRQATYGINLDANGGATNIGPGTSELQAVMDPYLTLDPSWEYAQYFKVQQESTLNEGEWVGITRNYLNPVPIPPAVWLFGSGLIGLIGIARRKKA